MKKIYKNLKKQEEALIVLSKNFPSCIPLRSVSQMRDQYSSKDLNSFTGNTQLIWRAIVTKNS